MDLLEHLGCCVCEFQNFYCNPRRDFEILIRYDQESHRQVYTYKMCMKTAYALEVVF